MLDTLETRKKLDNAICKNHSGKMIHMWSISTSTCKNWLCNLRASIEGSICAKCYARNTLKRRDALSKKLERNTELLTKEIYPLEAIPELNCRYFRFEAFGDLNNYIQIVNYFRFCEKNPCVRFALWTKNPIYINQAIKKGYAKPDNLVIVYSSLFTNIPVKNIKEKYTFIDKVFTVYSKKFAKENNIEINCGGNKCIECLRCYRKDTEEVISELLK